MYLYGFTASETHSYLMDAGSGNTGIITFGQTFLRSQDTGAGFGVCSMRHSGLSLLQSCYCRLFSALQCKCMMDPPAALLRFTLDLAYRYVRKALCAVDSAYQSL